LDRTPESSKQHILFTPSVHKDKHNTHKDRHNSTTILRGTRGYRPSNPCDNYIIIYWPLLELYYIPNHRRKFIDAQLHWPNLHIGGLKLWCTIVVQCKWNIQGIAKKNWILQVNLSIVNVTEIRAMGKCFKAVLQ
jgi:hypothetical protein